MLGNDWRRLGSLESKTEAVLDNMDAVLDDEETAAELRDIVMECHLQTMKNRRWG